MIDSYTSQEILAFDQLQLSQYILLQLSRKSTKSIQIHCNPNSEALKIEFLNFHNYLVPETLKIIENSTKKTEIAQINVNSQTQISFYDKTLQLERYLQAFAFLHQKLLNDVSLKSLMLNNKKSIHQSKVTITIPTETEHFKLMQEVIQFAIPVYHEETLENGNGNQAVLNINGNRIEQIESILQEKIAKLKAGKDELLYSFEIYAIDLKRKLNLEYVSLYDQFTNLKKQLYEHCINYGLETPAKPGLINFSAADATKYNSFQKIKSQVMQFAVDFANIHPISSQGSNDLNDIKDCMDQMEQGFREWTQHSNQIVEKNIKRLNPFHSLKSFAIVLAEIEEVFNEINLLKIFKRSYTINSQNYDIIVQNLNNDIVDLIAKLKFISTLHKHKEWTDFYNNLNEGVQKQFQQLAGFEKEKWESIFSFNFNEKLIEKNIHPSLEFIKKIDWDVEGFEQLISQQIRQWVNIKIEQNWNDYAKKQTRNKEQLKKDVISDVDEQAEFCDQIGAIRIKISEDLPQEKILVSTLSYDGSEIKTEMVMKKELLQMELSSLYAMHEISVADRFKIASSLATALLFYAGDVRVFQTKNANVISLFTNDLSNAFFEKLQPRGVKEIRVQDNTKNLIVESILVENTQSYLLLSDAMLDSETHAEFHIQRKIISAFEKIGFQILSLYTTDYHMNASVALDEITKGIH